MQVMILLQKLTLLIKNIFFRYQPFQIRKELIEFYKKLYLFKLCRILNHEPLCFLLWKLWRTM